MQSVRGADNGSGAAGSVAEGVYAFVREQIVSGALPAGSRVTEAWVTNETKASRTPVREALRRLTAEGYVEFIAHRGARVASLGLEDRAEIFALRLLLEPFAAATAATVATASEHARLQELTTAMKDLVASRPEAWSLKLTVLNREFHHAIFVATGYGRLRAMTDSLMLSGLQSVTYSTYTDEELGRSMFQHDELVAAIGARDEHWARAAMYAHIRAASHVAARIDDHSNGPPARKGQAWPRSQARAR
jgi:DNA-binding GntR family transcriptional regulator